MFGWRTVLVARKNRKQRAGPFEVQGKQARPLQEYRRASARHPSSIRSPSRDCVIPSDARNLLFSFLVCELDSPPKDGVEKQLESAFGLGAVLDAESEHHDFALASRERDDGGFALETFGAVGVAGD